MPGENMTECVLGYRGLEVAVRSEVAAPLRWLHEFVSPWMDDADRGAMRVTIDYVVDAGRYAALAGAPGAGEIDCFTMDGGFERHMLIRDTPDERVIHHVAAELVLVIDSASRQITIVASADRARSRVALLRVVRELMTIQAMSRGDLPLHAAGFAAASGDEPGGGGGGAVLFAGAKRAGKTTMLLDALRHPVARARLLSNDRVMVRMTEAGPIARGMPTIVSVRPDSLARIESLTPPRWPHPYRHYLSMRECIEGSALLEPAHRDPTGMSPHQFCRWMNVEAVANAPLAAVVFPVIDPGIERFELTPLSVGGAAARLSQSLFASAGVADAFTGFRPDAAMNHAAARCVDLARRGACYECRLGPHAFDSPELREAIAAFTAEDSRRVTAGAGSAPPARPAVPGA